MHQHWRVEHLYGVSTISEERLPTGIVASAAAGDELAFARIVAAHDDDMVRVAYLVTTDVGLAHEAVQAAWLIAWRKLRTLRDPERLRPWLVSVAANEARQILRRRKRRTIAEIPIDSIAGAAATGAAALPVEQRLDLANAVRRLSPEDRSIVAMRYGVGLTSDEIGRAIGLSPPGVRSRLARSLSRLRKELTDD